MLNVDAWNLSRDRNIKRHRRQQDCSSSCRALERRGARERGAAPPSATVIPRAGRARTRQEGSCPAAGKAAAGSQLAARCSSHRTADAGLDHRKRALVHPVRGAAGLAAAASTYPAFRAPAKRRAAGRPAGLCCRPRGRCRSRRWREAAAWAAGRAPGTGW